MTDDTIALPPSDPEDGRFKLIYSMPTLIAYGRECAVEAVRLYIAGSAGAVPLDEHELDDMASAAFEEAMAFGVSVDSFRKPLKTLVKKLAAAPTTPPDAQGDER